MTPPSVAAQIRLSTEKPSDFLVDVVDQAGGLPLGSYTALGTQTELLISLAFPRRGNYQVVLQGKLASDPDNNRMAVASTGLISVGSSDPTD